MTTHSEHRGLDEGTQWALVRGTQTHRTHHRQRQGGSVMSDSSDRTAYWGSCEDDDCGTAMIIYPHRYAPRDLPDEDEWENGGTFYIDCPVCGGRFDWGGTDPADSIIKDY